MKTIIIYKSKTGFTKKYAEIVADKVNATVADVKTISEKSLSDYDVIVYGSGVHAGMIGGLSKAKELFWNSKAKQFVVFATGATPNAANDTIEEIWKNNFSADELTNIPHFYMQSGLCYEKMPFFDKTLMKTLSKIMKKKKNKNENEKGFAKAIQSSYDISSEEYAQPLINYLVEENRRNVE